jgi:hypothetical protein
VTGFFPDGMALNGAGHWLNAADIEIDHTDPTRENCRMMLMTRTWWSPHYGNTFVKMTTSGAVVDTFSEYDHNNPKNPIPQMYYGIAINRDPANSMKSFLTCVEHSSFLGNARTYHTYAMPWDW